MRFILSSSIISAGSDTVWQAIQLDKTSSAESAFTDAVEINATNATVTENKFIFIIISLSPLIDRNNN